MRSTAVRLLEGVHDEGAQATALGHFTQHAGVYWDKFYKLHAEGFFKDRHYLEREFDRQSFEQASVMLEIGCGVGNTVLPLLDNHRHLRAYACDFSAIAVSLLAKQAASAGLQDRLDTFVADLRVPGALRGPHKLPGPHCIDVITAMFVLSAIEPSSLSTVRTCTWQYNHGEPSTTAQAVHNLRSVLRPGGLVLLRDYADGDLAQHRLAGKAYPPHTSLSATAPSHRRDQCLGDRLYVRQDGTMCCYFTELIVHDVERTNAKRGLTMRRRWLQGVFRLTTCTPPPPDRPPPPAPTSTPPQPSHTDDTVAAQHELPVEPQLLPWLTQGAVHDLLCMATVEVVVTPKARPLAPCVLCALCRVARRVILCDVDPTFVRGVEAALRPHAAQVVVERLRLRCAQGCHAAVSVRVCLQEERLVAERAAIQLLHNGVVISVCHELHRPIPNWSCVDPGKNDDEDDQAPMQPH